LPDVLKQYLVFSAERPGEDKAPVPVDGNVPAYAASGSEEASDEEDDQDNSSDDFGDFE
jgi:hypothetical protein